MTQLIYSQGFNDNILLYKIDRKTKVYSNSDNKWTTHVKFNIPQATKKFPKEKKSQKSHSLLQAKTNELPPTIEYHFVWISEYPILHHAWCYRSALIFRSHQYEPHY